MNFNQQDIENLVGTKIRDLSFYQRAFTHKSALKEYEQFNVSFETLEFMGDSVLGFIITKFLFDRYEERQEGFLTKARTKLVRSETLAAIALKLGLNKLVLMDERVPEMDGIITQRSWKTSLKPSSAPSTWIWVSSTRSSSSLGFTMIPNTLI